MDFREKIDNILKARGIARWKLAQEAGINSTIEKAYQENREMRESTTQKFLEALKISPDWWHHGTPPIFLEEKKRKEVTVSREAWEELQTTLASQRVAIKDAAEQNKLLTGIIDRLTKQVEEKKKTKI